MSTLTGTRINRYQILELLGIGGMGEVYRARDSELQRDVAIKFLPQAFANSPERLARFGQEARTASSLNHPNIITIHEVGAIPGGPPFIVMEYVQGHTLRAMLQEAPFPDGRSSTSPRSWPTAWARRTPRGSCIAISSPRM